MKFIPRSGVIIIYTAAYQFNIGRTRLRRQMPIRRAQSGFLPASAAQPIKSTIRHIRQTRISARTANAACTRERNGKNHEDTYRGGTLRSTIHKLSMRSGAVYYDLDRTAAAREVHIGTQRARRKPGARPIGTRAIRCRSERCSARHNGCCRRDARKTASASMPTQLDSSPSDADTEISSVPESISAAATDPGRLSPDHPIQPQPMRAADTIRPTNMRRTPYTSAIPTTA